MKKFLILITLCLFLGAMVHTATAQNIIDKSFSTYRTQDNFTSIRVTGKMFELASYIETEEDNPELEEFKEFAATIKELNVIIGSELTDSRTKYVSGMKKINSTFEELMNVKDQEGEFTFFIDEVGGVVRELAVIGHADEEFMVFSLIGNMELRQLSKLSRHIQSGGYNQVGKMFDHGVGQVRVYPNPATTQSEVNMEVPDEMVGGTATLYNMQGAVLKQIPMDQRTQELGIQGLSSGSYILEFKKGDVSIKKRVILQ